MYGISHPKRKANDSDFFQKLVTLDNFSFPIPTDFDNFFRVLRKDKFF